MLEVSRAVAAADQQEQEDQAQDFLQHFKQEGVKHAELGSFLDKLGGAIAGKRVSTLDIKVLLPVNHSSLHPGTSASMICYPTQHACTAAAINGNSSL